MHFKLLELGAKALLGQISLGKIAILRFIVS